MAKQMCRYCIYLVVGNGIYCTERDKELAESTTKTANKCQSFRFTNLDAYGETKGYVPKPRINNEFEGQLTLDLGE